MYDSVIFGGNFCRHQDEWLTGTACAVLGVISTIGSQASLFAMTYLSLSRVCGIVFKPMAGHEEYNLNLKVIRKKVIMIAGVIFSSVAVAVIPFMPFLEDYFIQGIRYDPKQKVFIGFPNKERHVNVLRAYFGDNTTHSLFNISDAAEMSWKEIGDKVDSMFSHQYGNITRSAVHFYGNDGVCLFKYFVRSDDARRSRQEKSTIGTDITKYKGDFVVWTMLAVNFSCFSIITLSYIVILMTTKRYFQMARQHLNTDRVNEEKTMETKTVLIVFTDFLCWVPFIIVSTLHNLKTIDATSWYTALAMLALPLNSAINPVIYDDSLRQFMVLKYNAFIHAVVSKIQKVKRSKPQEETMTSIVTRASTQDKVL
jgi:hypothetical protein